MEERGKRQNMIFWAELTMNVPKYSWSLSPLHKIFENSAPSTLSREATSPTSSETVVSDPAWVNVKFPSVNIYTCRRYFESFVYS